jgi:hypothetical protein
MTAHDTSWLTSAYYYPVKFPLEEAMKAQRGSTGTALLFL